MRQRESLRKNLSQKRDSVTSFSAREAGRFQTDFGLIFCGRGVPPEPENYQVARLDVFSRLRQSPSFNQQFPKTIFYYQNAACKFRTLTLMGLMRRRRRTRRRKGS